MNEIVLILKTAEECEQLAIVLSEFAQQAKRRSAELSTLDRVFKRGVELDLWEAIYAYEEVLSEKNKRRTIAARTRQAIKRHGIIEAAENAVRKTTRTLGFETLVAKGLKNRTFEAVILRYTKSFSKDVVKIARKRLAELDRK